MTMKEPTADEFDLCSLEELQERGTLTFEFLHPDRRVGRHRIGLFWDGEATYALEAFCPHEGALLTWGFVEKGEVVCPLHMAVFDLKTGECVDRFTYDTDAYETEVRDGRVWVRAPGEERTGG